MKRFMLTDIYGTDSHASTLRISGLPDDVIATIACFLDTRSTCAFSSTCTQFRTSCKFFGSVKLTKAASERLIFEPELREKRLFLPVRNIHIRLYIFSLTEKFITGLRNIERLTWLKVSAR
jgi:hypothetical protein